MNLDLLGIATEKFIQQNIFFGMFTLKEKVMKETNSWSDYCSSP